MSSSSEKLATLKNNIAQYPSVVIAYSGGVDSTFLAWAAREVLGNKVLLVTATSSTYPFFELDDAKRFAADLGMQHRIIVSEEIDIPGFADNPPDRCYYCKGELFDLIVHIARGEGYAAVFDGSNADDTGDYRPGRRAVRERGVRSPLMEVKLTKDDIRAISREAGLPTADKPSFACLASRFPYGERITKEKLDRVGKAEWDLRKHGYGQFRVRSHGDVARVEIAPCDMDRAWSERGEIHRICHEAGFVFVAIDLLGYRTGSMNEALPEQTRAAETADGQTQSSPVI